jgi:polar amino acid transport system substrate-binding protein
MPHHSSVHGHSPQQAAAELAPTGALRAGINLANFLLVTGRNAAGDPEGIAPDMAAEIARRLGVPVRYLSFANPSDLVDAVATDRWDIGLVGVEPARARDIAFTTPYAEIDSTYLVPAGSDLHAVTDVDRPGVRIASYGGAAYDLWLDANIEHAEIVKARSMDDSCRRFVDEKLDALAGLRPRLLSDAESLPGAQVLEGRFTTVRQAIGTARGNSAGAAFLQSFVTEAIASGFVARLIAKHKVRGLSVPQRPSRSLLSLG